MDSNAPLEAEAFRRLYPWLTDWFQRPNAALFAQRERQEIAAELGRRWGADHPIAVLDELRGRFGTEVEAVARTIVHENARRDWSGIASQQPANGIGDFIRLLWEPLRGAGFEFTYEKQGDEVRFHCTVCPHVAVARSLGAELWMSLLLCGSDEGMVTGFNPAIGFRRTRTLMEGHACCDHAYAVLPAAAGA
ncbi:MAG TPA: L-2-amino-thiazoline-4-carboxylic acid hydrolase [Opitutaceae bacterium]|nr:L-2-amino-thiazoline-4-carboxylic acid hydrolase [Opitutaceae bacterium]